MNKTTILVTLGVALLTIGGPSSAVSQQRCGMSFAPSDGVKEIQATKVRTFSAGSTEDLRFIVRLSAAAANEEGQVVSIRLRLPGGFLYQDIDLPVAPAGSAEAAGGAKRQVEGYPFPMEVVPLEDGVSKDKREGRPWVQVDVPVAGTSIVQSSLYGEWTAEAFLAGDKESACGPILTFRIVE